VAILRNPVGKKAASMIEQFAKDVEEGLSAAEKFLPSQYFYDAAGDALFVKIMSMPVYYLTNAEMEIFDIRTAEIIDALDLDTHHFEIVELGAGDGEKVIKLLGMLRGKNFTYAPIDISSNALNKLQSRLKAIMPWLDFDGQQGEYFEVLDRLGDVGKKVILFLGSNIGNLTDERAHQFMERISASMNPHDKLMVGFDLKKDPEVIEKAYDDPHGHTRAFNINLLRRINRELGGEFEEENFVHRPVYDANSGMALSYLESLKDQEVYIRSLAKNFIFRAGERIHTEVSRKYDLPTIQKIAEHTGLEITKTFYDSRKFFIDVLFEKIS
jgi:L-histidine N-alpha-methyltransferase